MEQFGGLSKYQVMVKPEPDIGYIQHSRQTWIPEINKSSYFESSSFTYLVANWIIFQIVTNIFNT